MGGVFEHREELGTLKEQGDEEKKKKDALAEERAHFQSILSGIAGGQLKAGMPAGEISKRFGKPSVEESAEWLYIDPQGKRLKNPRIKLAFDKDKRLAGWECFYVNCSK